MESNELGREEVASQSFRPIKSCLETQNFENFKTHFFAFIYGLENSPSPHVGAILRDSSKSVSLRFFKIVSRNQIAEQLKDDTCHKKATIEMLQV